MRVLFTWALLASILLVPSTGQAGWAENAQAIEQLRKGSDPALRRAIRRAIKKYCDEGKCSGMTVGEIVTVVAKDATLLAQLTKAIKPHLKLGISEVSTTKLIDSWIKESLKPGGVIYTEIFREGGPIREELDRRYARTTTVPVIIPDSSGDEPPKSLQGTFGFSSQFLFKQQGYFLLSFGLRTVGSMGDLELVALAGPGRDWERDAHMDFVLGFRAIIALEMVENFNFRLGATGVMKTATRDGNARSGDVAITGGIEVEFSRWFLFAVDAGPTWSLREDLGGIGVVVSGGPQIRIF